MKKGKLIIISGPSGVGKSTIRKELFKDDELKLKYSISMTTRKNRVGEENGVDYHFVTKEEFLKAIKEDKFLEHAKFVDNYYGTLKKDVEDLRNKGFNVVLEIEIKGAKQVMNKCPDALTIFLVAPSYEELRNRLIKRRSEPLEVIEKRLKKAKKEMKYKKFYKYVVVNDDLNEAVNEVRNIIINA